jgi:hypothetical protein
MSQRQSTSGSALIGRGTILDPLSQIVLSLMKDVLGNGYCLTTDSYYSIPHLADTLTGRKADSYGTVSLNSKEISNDL